MEKEILTIIAQNSIYSYDDIRQAWLGCRRSYDLLITSIELSASLGLPFIQKVNLKADLSITNE